jgi:hypothetical protein
MGVIQALKVINQMEADGIIGRYAIAGAIAASYYVEPALTEDIDVLVSFEVEAGRQRLGLVLLDPIFSYLRQKGYQEFRKEGIVIEGWPIQFVPVANDLHADALAHAREIEIDEKGDAGRTRVLTPEHIVAICLQVGRPKDFIRIAALLEANVVDMQRLNELLDRHGLRPAWRSFCSRNGISGSGGLSSSP